VKRLERFVWAVSSEREVPQRGASRIVEAFERGERLLDEDTANLPLARRTARSPSWGSAHD